MLLRACPSTSSHTRPQLLEHDDAFLAVERSETGTGWCGIRCGSQEKEVGRVPSTVGDVDVQGLDNRKFMCPVWREGDCGAGAGGRSRSWRGGGGVGSCARACVCNAAAAAVEVNSAVDAAASMQNIVSRWRDSKNRITVDPQAGCVSYQQSDR